jgi:exopolysaccharide production protein ExoY
VLPGLTGLAQISGRSSCTIAKRILLDIKYVESQTLALDISILLRTIGLIVFQRGAN